MNKSLSGWFFAILVGIFWGTPAIFGKFILQKVSYNFLVLAQYFFGFLTLGFFLFIQKLKAHKKKKALEFSWQNRKDILGLILGGTIGQGAFSFFSFWSLEYIPASENGIIQGLIPIFILMVSFLFHGERFTKGQILAALGAFVGIFLLVMDPSSGTVGFNKGHFICFLCVLSFACFTHGRLRLSEKYGAVLVMFYQFFFAGLASLLLFLACGESFSQTLVLYNDPEILLMVLGVGVGVSGVSYLLYIFAMGQIGVEKAGMALNIIPVSSFVFSVFVLGEEVNMARLFAIFIVLSSMFFFAILGRGFSFSSFFPCWKKCSPS